MPLFLHTGEKQVENLHRIMGQLKVKNDFLQNPWKKLNQYGFTAAEVVHPRANHNKHFMGLTTWKNAPSGKILKSDVSIVKNYLTESAIKELNHIVTIYLDSAELQASKICAIVNLPLIASIAILAFFSGLYCFACLLI